MKLLGANRAMYELRYHSAVIRDDIPRLSTATRLRIKKTIEQKLVTTPDLFGIPLRRSLKGYRKLRVGDYRVVFRLENNTVYILTIQHRSVVYKVLNHRHTTR